MSTGSLNLFLFPRWTTAPSTFSSRSSRKRALVIPRFAKSPSELQQAQDRVEGRLVRVRTEGEPLRAEVLQVEGSPTYEVEGGEETRRSLHFSSRSWNLCWLRSIFACSFLLFSTLTINDLPSTSCFLLASKGDNLKTASAAKDDEGRGREEVELRFPQTSTL